MQHCAESYDRGRLRIIGLYSLYIFYKIVWPPFYKRMHRYMHIYVYLPTSYTLSCNIINSILMQDIPLRRCTAFHGNSWSRSVRLYCIRYSPFVVANILYCARLR